MPREFYQHQELYHVYEQTDDFQITKIAAMVFFLLLFAIYLKGSELKKNIYQ